MYIQKQLYSSVLCFLAGNRTNIFSHSHVRTVALENDPYEIFFL